MELETLYRLSKNRELETTEYHVTNDYYGNAATLKKFAGLSNLYSIKAAVEHGPELSRGSTVWSCDTKSLVPGFIVCAQQRVSSLRAATNKMLFAVGSFVQYASLCVSEQEFIEERKRCGRTLLLMPGHSTHWNEVLFDIDKSCEYVKKIAVNYDTVKVCLGWKDVLNGFAERYISHGFECVTAGHMYDNTFLNRLRTIISLADAVMTNVNGGHVGYSVLLGKPVYIRDEGLTFETRRKDMRDEFRRRMGAIVAYKKEGFDLFGEFRSEITVDQQEYVDEMWGAQIKRSPEDLRTIFAIYEDVYQKGAEYFMNTDNLMLRQLCNYLNAGEEHKASFLAREIQKVYPEYADNSIVKEAMTLV